jgi:two-component system, OmpR family, sensor histidine kinase KdpD
VQHPLDWRRFWAGTIALVVGLGAASAIMLPLRSHLSVATASLVLVIPVVAAVVVGGPRVGLLAVPLGFVVFDLGFIPPYGRLSAGSAENWLTLFVYVAVVVLVGRVVSRLQDSRAEAARREADSRRVLLLSEQLAADKPVHDILAVVAASVRSAFDLETVALLMPSGGTDDLAIVASDGPDLGDEALSRIMPSAGTPATLTGNLVAGGVLQQIPLTAAGRPVGLLVLHGRALDVHDRGLLVIYANHAALAIERARLRDEALRADFLEQVDKWRAALVGTVAHDLRTPLASIKVAVSDLRQPGLALGEAARSDLLETIEEQTDRLTRLVSTVLDLWRLEAGALRPQRELVSVDDLIDEAAALVERSVDPSRLRRTVPADLSPLEVDPVLMAQVLANLLENAARHSPEGSQIRVEAAKKSRPARTIEIAVSDSGPGVPPDQRELIFEMFQRGTDGGSAGLGLAIAKAFVEAQGGRIGVGTARGGGARFVLTVPAVSDSVAAAELLDDDGKRS